MLTIFTIVKDGLPFLPIQLSVFNQLKLDWQWIVAEGTADNVGSTSWCAKPKPGLSTDGTVEFLDFTSKNHPRVTVMHNPLWAGKDAMCNACLDKIKEDCVLVEADADEIWTAKQLEDIHYLLSTGKHNCARFFCRYYVGINIQVVGNNGWGNRPGEWLRAWRFEPGMRFIRHEPPVLSGINDGHEKALRREQTKAMDLVFDHWAYCFPHQLRAKEEYYQYPGALAQWQRLQQNRIWPTRLAKWLYWITDGVMADLVHK